MRQNIKLFTSIWFIFGLVILLLNDFVLKEIYGNWLTGKISDFAGLLIFPLFWTTLFPKHKKKIFILTAIAFVLWKSSFSQILINTWNNIGIWKINRTVDYSDIIALLILPLAFHIEALREKLFTIRITPFIPLTICIYAFIATVRPTSNTGFDDNTAVYHIKHYSREDFMSELKNLGLDVTSSDYHNTKYYDEHTEINNLNDSIGNLVIMVGDFNKSNQTVEVSLAGWTYTKNPNRMLDDEELENQRAYVKSIFEQRVVRKLSK